MKTITVTFVILVIGIVIGIKIYPCIQRKGWIVNPIAKHNYDAYYEREKQYEEEKEGQKQFYRDAGIGYIKLKHAHYPLKEVGDIFSGGVTTMNGPMVNSFHFDKYQDRTKPFIATTSEIVFRLGCDIDVKTRRMSNFLFQEEQSYGPVYEIKCK